MEEFLPGGGLSFLIAQSADSVAAELARAEAANIMRIQVMAT